MAGELVKGSLRLFNKCDRVPSSKGSLLCCIVNAAISDDGDFRGSLWCDRLTTSRSSRSFAVLG